MWFVFFATFFLTALCSIVYIKNFNGKIQKSISYFIYILSVVIVLTGISEIFFDFGCFKGAFILMGCTVLSEFILYTFLRKNVSRTLSFVGKMICVATVLELTFFQFPSYRLLGGNYKHTVLDISQAELSGCVYDEAAGGVAVNGLDEISLAYHDLNIKIGTVHVDAVFNSKDARQVNFFADLTDETGYYYRMKIVDSKVISESPHSNDASVQMSGKTSSARFRFSGVSEKDECIIKGIELNRQIPFDVMPVRVILIVLLVTFIYACIYSATMRAKYDDNRYLCRVIASWLTIFSICCGMILVLQQIPRGEFFERFKLTEGDQITEELVLAFEQGRFDLPCEPSEELLAMDNPYDTASRYYDDVEVLWDHAFYNGKYYSYYGIAPLLLFVPYHLITGYFFPSDIAVMIFISVGLLLLSLLYSYIVRKWFGRISVGTYISALAMILASSGVWCSAGRPMFYELSISAGFMCCTAGAYFLITSGIFDKGRAKISSIFLSSLFLGLSVMCRPTLVLYALCGCVFFIMNASKQGKKNIWKYIICAFVPLMVLGAFQMYYNYSRFGSIFEFGIKYSLTINDFTHTEFHIQNMLIGIYNFLLAPPAFIPDYPFISAPFSFLGINGYYFKDEGTISGLMFLVLPTFAYLISGKALGLIRDKKQRLRALITIGLPCVIMPIIIVCSTWESGYSARYITDFSWQAVLGAFVILFYMNLHYEKETNKGLQNRIFTAIMGISCVYSVVVIGIESFAFSFPELTCPHYSDMLDRLLAFYK